MLAARGVSLGLGKINLSELNQLPISDRAVLGKLKRLKKKANEKPKLVIKKHVDKKTLWAACRAVVIGATIIGAGLFMTILGYFDRDLTTTSIFNITTGDEVLVVDLSLRYKLKMMQYIGPVLMGFGTFLLIIACVITLESRDRHAQIIQEESKEFRRSKRDVLATSTTKTSLLPPDDDEPTIAVTKNSARLNGRLDTDKETKTDRPNISDFQHDSNEETGGDTNDEGETAVYTNILSDSASKKEKVVSVEIHCPENGGHGMKNHIEKRNNKINNSAPSRFSASKSLLRLNRRSDKEPINTPREHHGSVETLSAANCAPLLLSNVNYLKPKGPAPIASVDSVLELPLLTSASCSTLDTLSGHNDR